MKVLKCVNIVLSTLTLLGHMTIPRAMIPKWAESLIREALAEIIRPEDRNNNDMVYKRILKQEEIPVQW